MNDPHHSDPVFLLVVGGLVVASMLVKTGAHRLRVPPVVGYLVLGAALRAADNELQLMPVQSVWTLGFLAQVGIVALLFRVGLRSDIHGLAQQLPRALRIWVFDVVVSAALAFTVARLAAIALIPALFVATALSATSVGVSVTVWEEAKQLETRLGQLLVDLAELDDLSAIVLMLVVVSAAPLLQSSDAGSAVIVAALGVGLLVLAKLVLFAGLCWLFAHFVEARFTHWVIRSERGPDRILSIVGVGFGISALAGVIGFSVAVGALFAGLMFSRDRDAVREEISFAPIHALFTPFFFVDVGYGLDPNVIGTSLAFGSLLFVPAVLGKVLGAGGPILRSLGLRAGLLLGVSMVPRAEIALLAARAGKDLGPWAMPDSVYGALVCTAALSSIASPLVLQPLLRRWPQVSAGAAASSDEGV